MRAAFARLLLKLWRWTPIGDPPPSGAVIICAPHTSNVDYLLMILVAWSKGMTLSWLGKKELFRPPLGWIMRATGGVSVDRRAPQGLVGQLADEFAKNPNLHLAIPAEGTRSLTQYWKSGFYRIAERAGVPMSLAFINKATRESGFGPLMEPSGDIAADMVAIRDFYTPMVGLKPENFGPVRLREEEADPGEESAASGG